MTVLHNLLNVLQIKRDYKKKIAPQLSSRGRQITVKQINTEKAGKMKRNLQKNIINMNNATQGFEYYQSAKAER
jgi:hypothetical protein